jgi:hypothetical protein
MKTFFSYSKNILLFFLLLCGISSCHKEGSGGKSSVSGAVMHHTMLIPNAVVYIKYGATNFPGSDVSLYDASVSSDANAHYEFKDLRKGDYYLYAVGYDNMIMETVSGGIGIQLQYNKETSTDIPVTE